MKLGFWDLHRGPGPSSKSSNWAFVVVVLLALLAVYAVSTSSSWAFAVVLVVTMVPFLTLLSPRGQKIGQESGPRMHQTLDLPIPISALPRPYRWFITALVIGFLLFLAFSTR